MTLAVALLPVLAILMALDLATTVAGMRMGAQETNELAVMAMLKLGPVRGLIVYQLCWFAFIAAVVIAAPTQWAMPLLGSAASGFCTLNNIIALSAHKGA